ncbi:putative ribonuclease H-like domain-containing protein [Tanacetum coccineum]|uniref:Ribonuclease H-like domain-containing protein n=1 Tax=Tanacetum coccineum TaxID=301880 RepID=A0ABQ4ZZ07_9ASTR
MGQYLTHTNYALWEVIMNGDAPSIASASTEGPIPPKTAEQKLARKNKLKAKKHSKLISQLEIHGEVISQEDVNLKLLRSLPSAWNNIALIMRNKSDLDTLSMDDLYNNLKVYESEIKGQSSSSSNSQNVAFVSSENTSSTNEAVNTTHDVSTASSQGQASSSTYADDVMFSFFANQSNSPQLDNEDLEQIDTDDLEEIDLKWQVAMLTMRVKRFLKKTGRNLNFNGKETVGFDKTKGNINRDAPRRIVLVKTPANALVVQDGIGGYDWSFQAEEGITNIALMDYTSQVLWDERIMREFSVARTSQQNRVAERKNRTLIEAARTMLADLLLPTTFWAEAVNTACYVQNRVLVTKPHNKTPYELLHGRPPSISFMRPFGCTVTILNILYPLGKFDRKADEGFLVGYFINSKAFRVFNTRTRKVEENLHITFLENRPNVAGSGPDWLFDIDLLTNFMNYKPVTTGNQTNRNSSKDAVADDAGKKITEKLANKGEINGQEKKGEASNKDGDQHVQDLRVELDKLLVQQKEGYANSTNRVSTASPSVSAVGGAYDDEDVGAEADLNNLETTMNVSPIPTTRIHKDYPKDQIIGDINPATQTRRMTKISEEHDMVNYVNKQRRTNHKDDQNCLFAYFLSQMEPKKVTQALTDPSWIEAMQDELLQFRLQKVQEPTDDKEKELWVELKRLFEPDNDDILWKLQRYMHDPLVRRLYDTCGVHHVSSVRGHDIFMLVEKEYPLTRGTLGLMMVARLLVEVDSEMSRELLRKDFPPFLSRQTDQDLSVWKHPQHRRFNSET